MEFVIEKDVPLAPHGNCRYPFGQLEVGDSFALPIDIANKVRTAAFSYGKAHGMKFAVRKQGDHARVWRIE